MYKKAFELSYKNKKVEIEIQDFVGDVRNINGTKDLFSLSYISDSKDKGQSILVTEADINFYADDYFNIDELKTVGETDIKVKYYEDDNLHWSGFVIPDFFSTSVDTAPVVSMVATDRIGTLKEISNNAESNIPIQILASCLKQTGQDLPINLIADNNHFETPIQLERIEDIASYDVIRTFMVLFNCKITLYKNAWWVINKKLLESGFVNYKSYNSNGVGGSVTPFAQPILDIDLVDRDGQREIKPTASEISLFLEFGGSKKYPNNWNFEKWNGTTFDNWTNYNGFSQGKRQTEIIFYTRIDGYYQAYLSEIETENKSLWYVARWYSNKLSDNILDYPNLKSSSVNVPKERGFIDIALNGNFTTRDGMPIWIVPLIHNKTNGNYFTYNKEGVILKIGSGTPNLNQSNFDYVHNPRASSQNGFNPDDMTHASVDVNWDIKNTFDLRDFGSDSDEIEMQVVFLGGIYLQGSLDYGTDVFLNAVNISFNDSQVTGKGLIFKVKQGGEKFSKSRDPETILFSDKINQGVNGYFYNYKYDDTSIVDLPSEFALSSVRERADMFSKARDYYSLDGNFIVNPLAKYVCGLKSFVLVGGENRREDASIIVEEIVSNTLNRTDFIYTYFDDGKDKVKSIGTASGGSSSSGGGGSSSSGGGGSSPSVPQLIKEDEEGNYYSEQPFYSLGGLSAFGFSEVGDGNGGGGIINVIDNLTSTSKTDPLSANQGRYLKTLIDNIEVGEGGQVIVDWEAITGKPTTFTPSAHTHIIGDVTGLQSALDGKASLYQLDGKEDAFTKNSAFNKNFGTGLNDVARGNHTHAFESLTSKPTTLGGYGITDGANKVHTHAISDVTNLQTELNKKATNTALTTHVNKTDNPHSVTKSQVGLGNVANKDLSNVDNIQQATKTEFTSHKNLFDSMFRKVGTNIEAKLSLYSLGGLSAYGFSEEGSETGGGIVNILPSWESYTSDKSGWALSAGLGKGLYDNKADKTDQRFTDARTPLAHTHVISDITGLQGALNSKTNQTFSDGLNTRLTSIEGGSATTINVSGTGDLLASVSKVGNNINFIKGNQSWGNLTGKPSTFAPSAHSHPISDITNLQTELNKKATNTALTTHVNKTDNPHSVTKSQVGLGNVANKDLSNVDNIQQATKTEFTSHKNLFDSMFRKVGTNIEAKLSLYSLGGLSAYGFSEEGSETGGGIVNILPSWESYTSDKSGWALSAGLGVDLNTRKADKTWVESLLEDYVPTDTTYTAGRGLTLTGTVFSTSFDIANYATVTALGGKVDKATTLSGYGITDAYTKTNVDTLLSGKENAFTKNSAFNKNFGTIVGTVAQGNHTHSPSQVGLGNVPNIDFRDYGLGLGVSQTNYLEDVSNDKLSGFYWGNNVTENAPFQYSTILYQRYGTGDNRYNALFLGSTENRIVYRRHRDGVTTDTEVWTDKNHRSNSENDTRYKAPFDAFKTTFDTMFRKTSTNEIEAKLSLYTLGGLSAYGFSDEGSSGGGGGIINILDDWTKYDASKSGWALSAGLGKGLYDNKADKTDQRFTDARTPLAHTHVISDITGLQGALNSKTNQTFSDGLNTRLTSIEGGSATTINVSGTGDLLASVSKVGNNINFIKGNQSWGNLTGKPSTFAPSAHSHPISDITNLQTELNKKATNTALTTHVNKTDNPHSVTKSQVGLGNVANKDLSNVDNIQQATKTEFTSHKNLFDSMFRKVGTNIEAKLSLYSLGGLSAYGFSEEGSETGGGIVNILPSWESYTSDKSGWALSAGLGVDLNTRKADKTWVESLLEDYVPTDTTYTAGRGLTLTGTVFSTSFDIANYATVTALGGKVDKATTLSGYGITDAYTKTNVDTLLSGKENAFTKNSAFNKNFGTIVGTVAQGNHTHSPSQVGLGNVPNIDFRDYGLGLGVSQTNYLEDVSNDKLSGFYWGNNVTENAPFQYSTILYQRYGTGDNRYNALFLGSTENRIVYRRHRDGVTTDTEVWTDKNHRSNSENDTRYKAPFDAFKTTFDTMFRKTSTNEIEAKLSLYTLGGLSAYGFSDEGSSGGGGGIINILDDWTKYDASKSGWALSAGLGKGLYDDKADKTDPRFTDARTPLSHTHIIADVTGLQTALNSKTNQTFSDGLNDRLTNVESGSATTVNTTGTGDLLASVSKVGNNINFIKGNQSWGNLSGKPSTFAPSAHTHPISDITNLQTTLNNKLATSIFNTHNTDNVRHITGAERTKWDGVVTDFDNLEIGSRNYILHSLMMGGNNPTFGDDDRGRWYNVFQGVRDVTLRDVFKENTQYTLWYERGEIDSGNIRFIIRYTDGTNSGNIFTNVPFITPKDKTVSYVNITYGTTGRLEIINPTFVEGNKPMKSWTPAPEDQVSDWNTTDVNSFSFIKNKPTLLSQFTDNIGVATHIANKANPHSVTKAQIGLSNVDNAKQATKVEFDLFKSAFDEMFRKVGANIEAKLPLYSLGGLSAYGFSDEGSSSGGGIVNILPSWESYDTSKSGWALSAGLGENLRTRVVALENAEIDLSGYATLNYVNDKVKTNVPLNAKFTDTIVDISGKVDKKTGFSLISDTEITRLSNVTNQDLSSYAKTSDVNNLLGGKVDKVTGKSLISDTEITRLSSVTNQDLTPYALKTYVDTEVGKKWTYNETTIKAVKVSNAVRADNVGGFTVGVNVPSNAKFTDTIVDISGKVDKVTGKGLSTNDFTTVEKNKLAILENQTRESLGVDNVTNESKATMFTNPTFTGTTKVTILELDSNWKFVKVGDNIELQFDGVTKQIMTDNGDIIATAGVTAYE